MLICVTTPFLLPMCALDRQSSVSPKNAVRMN
jgi:hypothetical protein